MDRPSLELERALTVDVVKQAQRYVSQTLQPLLDDAARRHGVLGNTCDPEQAGAVLRQCIDSTTSFIRREFGGYSSLRWLWMLRRLPVKTFAGDYLTTPGYDHTLAEVIAGQSRGRSRMLNLDGDVRAYPLDATVVRRLARFCASVRWLSNLHRDYRCAGKGFTFEFRRGQLLERAADLALRESIELYDRRVERSGGHGRMGTQVFAPNASTIELKTMLGQLEADVLSFFLRVVTIQPIIIQVPLPDAELISGEPPVVTVLARHFAIPLPIDSLSALIAQAPTAGRPVIDAPSAALLLLLFASTLHVVQHRAGFAGLFTTGYLLSEESYFRERIGEALSIAPPTLKAILVRANVGTVDEVIHLLEQANGSPWPLEAGPVLYRDEDALALDLVAAGRRLGSSIVFPRVQGELANVRGAHFELRAQASIDNSAYAPPSKVRALRGRTLKLNGLDVTDIDAIACLDERTILLVSCKSIIYGAEYDMGEYREVRNAATTVRTAQERWAKVLQMLRDNPHGDNYDFTGWNLIGVVCTSGVVWIELGPCTEEVLKGLRAVVSLDELQQWLNAERSTSQ